VGKKDIEDREEWLARGAISIRGGWVAQAGSVREAIARIEATVPQAVTLDISLPDEIRDSVALQGEVPPSDLFGSAIARRK
jgi:ActR/RegA family two-component response regulator